MCIRDSLVAVEVGGLPTVAARQQPRRRDLRPGIGGTAVLRKQADHAEPMCPVTRLGVNRLRRPPKSKLGRDVCGTLPIEKLHKICQRVAVLLQREPEAATETEIIPKRFRKRAHHRPPGQGCATMRSPSKSCLA